MKNVTRLKDEELLSIAGGTLSLPENFHFHIDDRVLKWQFPLVISPYNRSSLPNFTRWA